MSGSPGLSPLIRGQLDALMSWADLPREKSDTLRSVWELLTHESLDRAAIPPFPGLSFINANGLPFQWVLRFSDGSPGFGFLCEVGRPGETVQQRLMQSRERLTYACDVVGAARPLWMKDLIARVLPTDDEVWPVHWRSAMWIGVAASKAGVQLKPYFNLNYGSARQRWLRVGRVLQDLGRRRALERL